MAKCVFLSGERTCLPASGKIYGLFSCVAPFFAHMRPHTLLCTTCRRRVREVRIRFNRADIVRCDLISNKIAGII